MANKLMRGLSKLAKGIGYTLAVFAVATVVSGLLAGPIGAAAAGYVFLGILGAGGFTAVQAARGKTRAKKAQAHRQEVSSYADIESRFADDYAAHLDNKFSDPAQRQAFHERELALQDKSRQAAQKQRDKEDREFRRQQEEKRKESAGDPQRRAGSSYESGSLTTSFQSAAGQSGGQSAIDQSRAADDARRREDQRIYEQQQLIRMTQGPNGR